MYKVYADETCIYNDILPGSNTKLLNPKLTVEENAAGSFTCVIPKGNAGYDLIERLNTEIIVQRNGTEIWRGRVMEENTNFYEQRSIYCEGELAYFNDTVQPPVSFSNITPANYLSKLLEVHNSRVEDKKKFTLGNVTMTKTISAIATDYDITINAIYNMIDMIGGYLRIRHVNGVRYLDYLASYPETNTQKIQFGKNLLDLAKTWDVSNLVTVIIPLGKQSQNEDGSSTYVTVASVNNESIYVESSSDAIQTYGRIESVVNFSDIDDPTTLLQEARDYLSDYQFDTMSIEASAVDLNYLDSSIDAFQLLDTVQIVSKFHGLDRMFPVSRMEISLDDPTNSSLTLGTEVVGTLTKEDQKMLQDIHTSIAGLPNQAQIEAILNSIQQINNNIADLPTSSDYEELQNAISELPTTNEVKEIFTTMLEGYLKLTSSGTTKKVTIEGNLAVMNNDVETDALTEDIPIGDKILKIVNGIPVSFE